MSNQTLNKFCRMYDLIFIGTGTEKEGPVYYFLDSENDRRYYTATEIEERAGEW